MEKTVTYRLRHFDEPTVRRAMETLRDALRGSTGGEVKEMLHVMRTDWQDESWAYDNLDEFFADTTRGATSDAFEYGGFMFEVFASGKYDERARLDFSQRKARAGVGVEHSDRAVIERVHAVFRDAAVNLYVSPPPRPEKPKPRPRVFIGHGGKSTAWRDLKDHLADKHDYEVVAYETGARSGHTIRDILEEMLGSANFALLVMTPEDEQANGGMRARQNVIHEAGLFQGKLGFARAIIIREKGVENFSNIDGVQYIEYQHGINETFGEVLATLRREFD